MGFNVVSFSAETRLGQASVISFDGEDEDSGAVPLTNKIGSRNAVMTSLSIHPEPKLFCLSEALLLHDCAVQETKYEN